MACDRLTGGGSKAFLERLNREGRAQHVPMTGNLALTHRCNLMCRHCYAGPAPAHTAADELPTERWLQLVDELVDAGCLFLLLTGGEPLLRSDFMLIYRRAVEAGMLVSVFTNGVLLDEAVIRAFQALPPLVVEVSLYGASAATYERITGVPGSYTRARRGVDRLREAGVRFRLKSVLLKDNEAEFAAIRGLAEEHYGVEFRMDSAIMPRLDGDREPLGLRVDPETAVAIEMQDAAARTRWEQAAAAAHTVRSPGRGTLYTCGAGVIGFHVEPDGRLLPCLMVTDVASDVAHRAFADGWRDVVTLMQQVKAEGDVACRDCAHSVFCGWCPAYARLEHGRAEDCPEYLCRLGHARRAILSGGESDNG